jgi:hypothetical protein
MHRPRHAIGEADYSVSWDVRVGRVVRVRDAGMGNGVVVSNCGQRPVLNGLSSCLLQARRVFEAEPGFCWPTMFPAVTSVVLVFTKYPKGFNELIRRNGASTDHDVCLSFSYLNDTAKAAPP